MSDCAHTPIWAKLEGVDEKFNWLSTKVDGRKVSYVRTGRGRPLVLLHGFTLGHSTLTYGPSIAPLAGHFDVIVPDLPGYGSSEPFPNPFGTEGYIRFLAQFLDVLGLEKISLVGFSKGGGISLGFALEHPKRLHKLALVSSYALSGAVQVPLLPYLALRTPGLANLVWRSLRTIQGLLPLYLKNLVFGKGNVPDVLIEEIREPLSQQGSEQAFMTWLRGEMGPLQLKTNYADQLGELAMPTLLLHGTRDLIVPAGRAKRAAKRIPNVELELFRGCGHWLPREVPERFVKALCSFLDP